MNNLMNYTPRQILFEW